MKVFCCGKEPIWIENVPGKGYNFCQECRKEVLTPLVVELVTPTPVTPVYDGTFDYYFQPND